MCLAGGWVVFYVVPSPLFIFLLKLGIIGNQSKREGDNLALKMASVMTLSFGIS